MKAGRTGLWPREGCYADSGEGEEGLGGNDKENNGGSKEDNDDPRDVNLTSLM